MRFERVGSPDHPAFERAMTLYSISFPRHEQREQDSQLAVMPHPDYHFNIIFDDDMFVGLMLCWETENFIYVEHFCILPELRNRNYGSRSLDLLTGREKTVILEIDPPADEISTRRRGFYERAGFVANPFTHVHPPYHKDYSGHGLMVMSSPSVLSRDEYDRFSTYLSKTVMAL